MSHEDVLLIVDAIKSVALAVRFVVYVLVAGIAIRELTRRKG